MKFATIGVFLFCLFIYPAYSQQPEIIFSDDFEDYQDGSTGFPTWTVAKGFWQIVAGKFVQKTMEYDCAAMLDLFIDYSFELECDFRVIEGEPGAGFFFHSGEIQTTEFSHMSRFESDKTMLIGHFMQGGYRCTHSARFEEQDFTKWHRLTLRVDQDKKQYRIFLDGRAICKGEPILFPAGYCGLQSSGGIIEFDNVTLKRLPMKGKPVAMSWINHFLVTKKNELIIPHPARGIVQRLDRNGKFKSSFGLPISKKGQFKKPTSIAALSNGDFIIGDLGCHRVHLFDKKGNWKNSAGYLGSGKDQFDQPAALAVDSHDNIYVVDEGNNRVQVLDKNLKFITEFGKKELDHPAAAAVKNDTIFVLNNGMNEVEIYHWNGKKIDWLKDFSFGNGVGRDILYSNGKIYISAGNEIRSFDEKGELLNKFTGKSIRGIYPYGLAAGKNGAICAADFQRGHIIILDPDLSEPEPAVEFPSNREAMVSLATADKVSVTLQVMRNDTVVFKQNDKRHFLHQFHIDKLKPSTCYHLQFSPTVPMIPPADDLSKVYPFITPPEPGQKHYWRLPLATIIFTNVLDSARWKPTFPELPPLPDAELNRIQSQLQSGIRFYWMNSGMNLFLDNDFIIVDKPLFHHQIFGSQWWYPPKQEWVIGAIGKLGKTAADYVAVLYIACVRDYNEKTGSYELRGRGGGFTSGIGANSQYGLSYWEATHANHSSGNNWLMVHEFHHQLDELFLASGYPEYWFNHFSPAVNTAADFGEHFDGNAWILKNWDTAKWYDLKFGQIQFTADQDGDGIPDDDPVLPMDENRLNSNPRSKDSDDDGVPDLAEIRFSNWISEGCGETYGGEALFPNLLNSDTDRDGIPDDDDPYPLYPFEPVIKYCQLFQANSTVNYNAERLFARLFDQRIHAWVYAGWDSSSLNFIFKMDRLAPVKLMIDANADGWFLGRDNFLLYLKPEDESKLETELVMVNCADPTRWPFHDKELAKRIHIRSTISMIGDNYAISVTIPRNKYTGLKLEMGEQLGINIGFSVIMDAAGHERYITIFEPNRFFDVKLIDNSN